MPLIKKSIAWLFLSSLSLALAGLFSVIIVFARVPVIKEILPFADLFRTALVIHVDLSQIFWFMTVSIALSLCCFKSDDFIDNILKKITIISLLLITLSTLTGGTPILSNYVPFIDNNIIFSLSISLFFTIIVIYNLYLLYFGKSYKNNIESVLQTGNQITIITAFAILLLTIISLKPAFPTSEYYEYLFWGFGHILQFSYCYLLMHVWVKLCDYKTNFPKTLTIIVLMHGLFAVLASLYFMSPDITSYKIFFTKHMSYISIAPTLLMLLLLIDRKNISFKAFPYGKYYLLTSITLFLFGGIIALFIKESNTIIPAHYHGSIVAITIAIMGFILLTFSQYGLIEKSYKLIKIVPLTYFTGQLMHIGGLALSGGYGALRKSPDSLNNAQAKFWMGIMGMGGLIAIIAGFIFIYICYIAFKNYKKRNYV
ncbi:MAG: hypothetical protein HON23_04415 [Rickettsiales bacterium]|jgi:cytochrome c oxidase subunit I|nr:hypothetical protein [Rickettsiales bacterium]